MITALVLYDLPETIGLEECRAHFTKISPDFLDVADLVSKQFICMEDGKTAGGVYMWKNQEAAKSFYSGPWLDGIRARYGNDPRITFFETLAFTEISTGVSGAT